MNLKVFRQLLQRPGFTALSILTLAIGIGANTAIFAVIEGILLKPLPFTHSEQLIAIDHRAPGVGLERSGSAPFLWFTYRDESRTMENIALWHSDTESLTGLGEPEEIPTLDVTREFLPALQIQPALGRFFSQADDTAGSPQTAVLSYAFWQAKFGGMPDAIGRQIVLANQPRQIIGVLPRDFHFLDNKVSVILPLQLDPAKTFLGQFSYQSF